MILRIQPDESLRSYIERNLYLNWRNPNAKVFGSFSRFSLRSADLRKIAAQIGWPGCNGFNRLLHLHTHYPTIAAFKNSQDLSYSDSEYVDGGGCYGTDWSEATYCPECVKEDLQRLGFSYWRRHLRHELEVCATHNVVLVDACPNCRQPFSSEGHNLDVMWGMCEGVHLSECSSQKNDDPRKLKKARFYADLARLDLTIPVDAALDVLKSKIVLVQRAGALSNEALGWVENDVNRAWERLVFDQSNGAFLFHVMEMLIEALLELYDSFGQFVDEVVAQGYGLRRVETLWSTYSAGGSNPTQYVKEENL